MNKLKIALAAVAMIVAGTLSAQSLTDLNTTFSDAAEAIKVKKFTEAIPLLEQVIDKGLDIEGAEGLVMEAKKHLPAVIFQTGGSQFQGGNLDAALASFSKAAELSELYGNVAILNNARTWIGRTVLRQGADAFNSKDYEAAAAIFRKGYEGNPNDAAVAMNLAMSYIGLGDYTNGNEVYRAVMVLGEQDSRFAEAAAQAAQKFSEDNLARASEAAQAKNYEEALTAIEDLLATIPDDATANMLRLQTYNNMGNYVKVTEVGDAAVEAQTADELRSNANYLIGSAYQNRENYAKAIEYYRKVTAGANAASARGIIPEIQKLIK